MFLPHSQLPDYLNKEYMRGFEDGFEAARIAIQTEAIKAIKSVQSAFVTSTSTNE